MADHGTWKELALPGASLLARCAGRGRVLMDPASVLAYEACSKVARHIVAEDLECLPDSLLSVMLGQLLAARETISDELDRRTLP